MGPRHILFLIAMGAGLHARAQTCIQVTVQDEGLAKGTVVRCPDGSIPGIVDAFGRFCPRDPCDTLVFGGGPLQEVRLAWAEAVARGEVVLTKASRALAPLEIAPWPAKKDRQALAAVSHVDSLAVGGPARASLEHALATLPGVRMDERGAGGSARLSIRGSVLRSPYGTRGVKVYWGPFALTLADGSTPLELLDPLLVGGLDVVRSVGGPVYGSAPSGVLLADAPWRMHTGTTVEASAVAGSFGYYKLSGQVQVRDSDGTALSIGALRMDNNGYRAQEATHRDQVFLATQWRHGNGVTRAYLTLQQARWSLPGSIDSLTAQRDPRAARPYSQAIDAHISKQQVFGGLAHEQRLFGPLLLRTMVQAQVIEKHNPYGTTPVASGNKDEDLAGGGTRVSIAGTHGGARIGFAWELGLEGLVERDALFERNYAYAVSGAVRTDATTRVANLNSFLTTRTRLGRHTILFVDLGTERTGFRLEDALRGTELTTGRTARLHPLVGIEERLGRALTAHVRYAGTTSRPTIWELLGSEGVFNTGLKAEDVRETEAGVDLADPQGLWQLSAVGYLRTTDGMILQRRLDGGAVTVFENAGDAHQDGIELGAWVERPLAGRHRLRLAVNGAWQHHRLELPERADIDVPGVPRWTAAGTLGWRAPWGLGVVVEGRSIADVRAGTTTTAQVPGYTLWSATVEAPWRRPWGDVRLFVRGDNLTDARYTAFVQLDDPGGRYYDPGPGRGVTAGVAVVLNSNGAGAE